MEKKESIWKRGIKALIPRSEHVAKDTPFEGITKEANKKQLWGQEFDIVEQGLSEEQVIKFVNSLLSKFKTLSEKKRNMTTLDTLSEITAIEVERYAGEIKAKAKREAEAETAMVIAHANQKARGVMLEARKKAQDITQKEVEEIIQTAYRKAAIIETEAKQQSQLFLIRSRNSIQEQLRDEAKTVYNQLQAGLDEILNKGHDIEVEWKNKTINLWKSEIFDLDWRNVVPSALAENITATPTFVTVSNPAEEQAVIEEESIITPQAAIDEEMDISEIQKESAEEVEIPPLATVSDSLETNIPEVEEQAADEIIPPEEELLKPSATAEEIKTDIIETIMAETEEIKEEPEKAELVVVEAEKEEQRKNRKQKSKAEEQAIQKIIQTAYEGEVELILVPPVGLPSLSEIHHRLEEIPEAKILQTIGSWDKSTTIKVLLERPLTLADILTQIPGIEIISELTEESGLSKKARRSLGSRGKKGKLINRIALRTSA